MFCPNCRQPLKGPGAFCPNCGSQLPKIEKSPADINRMNLEQAHQAAGSGFDTQGPFLTTRPQGVPPVSRGAPVKTPSSSSTIGMTITGIVVFGTIAFALMGGGTVRNCIKSVLGGAPECSDCNGSSEPTTLNGRSMGSCTTSGPVGHEDTCYIYCGG